MGERRDYDASRIQKLLMGSRGRTVGTRQDIIMSARDRGVFAPLAKITSARPPFAPDDPPDDEDAN